MGEEHEAVGVLRDIWQARQQTGAELDALFDHPKSCKAMRHVGFQGGFSRSFPADTDDPVDEDLRAAWRDRLAREGKLRPNAASPRELMLGPDHR